MNLRMWKASAKPLGARHGIEIAPGIVTAGALEFRQMAIDVTGAVDRAAIAERGRRWRRGVDRGRRGHIDRARRSQVADKRPEQQPAGEEGGIVMTVIPVVAMVMPVPITAGQGRRSE